jgi:hypothetical protein
VQRSGPTTVAVTTCKHWKVDVKQDGVSALLSESRRC